VFDGQQVDHAVSGEALMIGGALVRRNKLDVADLVAQSRIGQAFEADSCSRCSPAAPDSIKLIANGSEVGDLAAHHPLHCGLPAKRKVRLVDPAVGVVRSLVDVSSALKMPSTMLIRVATSSAGPPPVPSPFVHFKN
jgi:hypothetical protein